MKLKPLSLSDVEQVRLWRNDQLPMLRTSFPLTTAMQGEFYKNVICNRQSNSRFWGIWIRGLIKKENTSTCVWPAQIITVEEDILIGMAGLENIQWENRLAEISLILNHEYNTDDFLQQGLGMILHEAFLTLNLQNIFTEVYECSHLHRFCIESANKYHAKIAILPNRKYWDGKYYDSKYINFNKEVYPRT